MIRVLLKKRNISKQKTRKQKVVASAKKDANKQIKTKSLYIFFMW